MSPAEGPLGENPPGQWCALLDRAEDGGALPLLAWRAGPGWRMASSGVVGGGIGPRQWWLNAQVPLAYARHDPERHVAEIAEALGLAGAGVGMLTAADVTRWRHGGDGGVRVLGTVGLGVPVQAAAPPERSAAEAEGRVGTINLLAVLPVPLGDAALVNAVLTITEAKTQALVEAAVPGTGTASDSVCIACPVPGPEAAEPFCGPRSPWGARLARAVYAAVASGTVDWRARHGTR